MPQLVALHNKADIEGFARENPLLHLYEIGDLDDFFWPHTVWYGWREAGEIRQLALVYGALSVPVLLAHADPPCEQMCDFLRALLPLLPGHIYAHLNPATIDVLGEAYRVQSHGLYWKMGLVNAEPMETIDTSGVVRLSGSDLDALQTLYRIAYPGNWFDAAMLGTGCYYGIRQGEAIISVAGVHVYSPTYKVAALGNVTTHPALRGRGLGTKVCAALCRALRAEGIEQIGLNVKADNAPAIASYTRLGFEKVADYGEYMLDMRLPDSPQRS